MIRSDNGREFIADTLRTWLAEQGVEAVFVAKASPQQNCYIERFNRSMRDELLHLETFRTLTEARVVIADWLREYNEVRAQFVALDHSPAALLERTLRAERPDRGLLAAPASEAEEIQLAELTDDRVRDRSEPDRVRSRAGSPAAVVHRVHDRRPA
ncbi:hypothetical protein GCM10028801_25010 [Nocardioides maradonensis]